jgi:hypothetical protein
MKWILFVYLAASSSSGVTSTVSTIEFNTYDDCRAAREAIREHITGDAPLSFATCLAKE